ncbi:MAG: class I SAM-dependent methyltransferase [Candidatus Pacebacteria bacterium CG10_big_fil_rev_8_21_14_0_10_44_54]|nr:MAG: class I SAM-dependent methyltransferase [Candidatus Pacebacteria bacterium CG10_big_fil_rev_8_21_14_0_10_44_54]
MHFIRKNRLLNIIPRIYLASTYFSRRILNLLKWLVVSKEDTNLTYDLTELNLKYIAAAISHLTAVDEKIIRKYFLELLTDKSLQNFVKNKIHASEFKSISDENVKFGRRIAWYAIVRAAKPKVIVESGVDKGLGSVVLCSALLKNKAEGFEGRYFGTEIVPEYGFLLRSPYSKVGEILFGDSITTLKKFKKKINIFINDSDHSTSYEYLEYLAIEKLLTDNSLILGDNSHVSDSLWRFSQKSKREFIFLPEWPKDHWYPGAGVGISFSSNKS